MLIQIPQDVLKIIKTLQDHCHEAFIVGGCVRDSLRDVVPKDWDITTSAVPGQVLEIFPRTFETGIKHGTITVLINRQGYEVTTYRIDGTYSDNRRPESVAFTANINEDLSRRDFTMNAIAYSPSNGFVDPFDGQGDINKKLIRSVGSAEHRFGEDALRMLRAIRFAGQLGFTVDDEIIAAISKRKDSLANISAERIREELTRLLISPYVEAVKLLETTGLLNYILRGREYGGDLDYTINLLAKCPENKLLRLAIFLAWSGDLSTKILRDLRFSNSEIREVSLLIHLLPTIPTNRYEIKKQLRIMAHTPTEKRTQLQQRYENLLAIQALIHPSKAQQIENIRQESRDIQAKNECYTLRDLTISGQDLVAAGIPSGKAIGDKLEELLDAVMQNPELNAVLYLVKTDLAKSPE